MLNKLLYIIENKDFSDGFNNGTLAGIDTSDQSLTFYLEGRVLKSNALKQELEHKTINYELLEIIANSQLDEIQSQELISLCKYNNYSTKEEVINKINEIELEAKKDSEIKKDFITNADEIEESIQTGEKGDFYYNEEETIKEERILRNIELE